MSRLLKDFNVKVIPGTAGNPGRQGQPAKPGYYVTTYVYVNAPPSVPHLSINTLQPQTLKTAVGIRIATFLEVSWIPELTALAEDVLAGRDPGETNWMVAVKNIITMERNSCQLGRPLYFIPDTDPYSDLISYLAVWSLGQGCGIYRFDGFTRESMPTMTIDPTDLTL